MCYKVINMQSSEGLNSEDCKKNSEQKCVMGTNSMQNKPNCSRMPHYVLLRVPVHKCTCPIDQVLYKTNS